MAKAVKPIPEGLHTVTPHLAISGAAAAIEFYKKAFGAQEKYRSLGPDCQSVIHAEIRIGDSAVFLADEMPGRSRCPSWMRSGETATGSLPTPSATSGRSRPTRRT